VSDIKRITDWRAPTAMGAIYERLLTSLGTDDFGATVRSSVLSLTAGARRIYLFEATAPDNTSLHYFAGEPGLVRLFPAYRRWYSRHDPLGEAFCAAPDCNDVALQRLRPAEIPSREFRRRFFDDSGIVERVSIIHRGADAWRGMNVARHASDGPCSEAELSSLIDLACLVLPMLPVHRARRLLPRPPTAAELEQRFAARHEGLTLRERQVCARAALGMTVDATAVELKIARTSVLTYRQRAYERLGVRTSLELRGLVTH
jgi:DNA-binding CsgD family transcriptional regulator